MYRERGPDGCKSEVTVVERKQRVIDVLDKHLERSSPSTSRAIDWKDKSAAHSVLVGKTPPDRRESDRLKNNRSDGSALLSSLAGSIYIFVVAVSDCYSFSPSLVMLFGLMTSCVLDFVSKTAVV